MRTGYVEAAICMMDGTNPTSFSPQFQLSYSSYYRFKDHLKQWTQGHLVLDDSPIGQEGNCDFPQQTASFPDLLPSGKPNKKRWNITIFNG